MKIESLGLVEVKGFLGAIAAADAALKTADVLLLNAEVIKGGQTTIQLTGDVAAVKVAVDSATAVAENLDCLLSSHVIPRMAEDTAKMVMDSVKKKQQASEENKVEEVKEEAIETEVAVDTQKTEKINSDVKKKENTKKKPKPNKK